jgi:peptidoglycan hydrolase CwlO-like protein
MITNNENFPTMLDQERVAKLETQVEAIKEDVGEVKNDIKELHSRITTGNREIMDKLDEKIDALAKSDSEQHLSLKSSMDKVKERVDILERWRWMIVGGAIVLGYALGHIDVLQKFIK